MNFTTLFFGRGGFIFFDEHVQKLLDIDRANQRMTPCNKTYTTLYFSYSCEFSFLQKEFKPVKYFSIDRVFRNENVDDTHLAEFHQIEGSVADYGLTLGDLMGIIQEFFKKLGITKLRFKPAYNPYTEPSMEIFSYHEGKRDIFPMFKYM